MCCTVRAPPFCLLYSIVGAIVRSNLVLPNKSRRQARIYRLHVTMRTQGREWEQTWFEANATLLRKLSHQSPIKHTTYPESLQLSQYDTARRRASSVCFETHCNYHRPGFGPARFCLVLVCSEFATTGGERSNLRQQSAIYLGTAIHKCQTLSRQAGIEQQSKHAQGEVLSDIRA